MTMLLLLIFLFSNIWLWEIYCSFQKCTFFDFVCNQVMWSTIRLNLSEFFFTILSFFIALSMKLLLQKICRFVFLTLQRLSNFLWIFFFFLPYTCTIVRFTLTLTTLNYFVIKFQQFDMLGEKLNSVYIHNIFSLIYVGNFHDRTFYRIWQSLWSLTT